MQEHSAIYSNLQQQSVYTTVRVALKFTIIHSGYNVTTTVLMGIPHTHTESHNIYFHRSLSSFFNPNVKTWKLHSLQQSIIPLSNGMCIAKARHSEYKMQSLFLFQNTSCVVYVYRNVSFVCGDHVSRSIYLFIFYTSFLQKKKKRTQNIEMKEFSWNYIHIVIYYSYLILQHCVEGKEEAKAKKKKNCFAELFFSFFFLYRDLEYYIYALMFRSALLGTFINVVIYEFTETFSIQKYV